MHPRHPDPDAGRRPPRGHPLPAGSARTVSGHLLVLSVSQGRLDWPRQGTPLSLLREPRLRGHAGRLPGNRCVGGEEPASLRRAGAAGRPRHRRVDGGSALVHGERRCLGVFLRRDHGAQHRLDAAAASAGDHPDPCNLRQLRMAAEDAWLPRTPAGGCRLGNPDGGLQPPATRGAGRGGALGADLARATGGRPALVHGLARGAARPRVLAAPPDSPERNRGADLRHLWLVRRLHRARIPHLPGSQRAEPRADRSVEACPPGPLARLAHRRCPGDGALVGPLAEGREQRRGGGASDHDLRSGSRCLAPRNRMADRPRRQPEALSHRWRGSRSCAAGHRSLDGVSVRLTGRDRLDWLQRASASSRDSPGPELRRPCVSVLHRPASRERYRDHRRAQGSGRALGRHPRPTPSRSTRARTGHRGSRSPSFRPARSRSPRRRSPPPATI